MDLILILRWELGPREEEKRTAERRAIRRQRWEEGGGGGGGDGLRERGRSRRTRRQIEKHEVSDRACMFALFHFILSPLHFNLRGSSSCSQQTPASDNSRKHSGATGLMSNFLSPSTLYESGRLVGSSTKTKSAQFHRETPGSAGLLFKWH